MLLLFSAVGTSLLIFTWDLRPYPLAAFVDDYRYILSAVHIKAALWNILHNGGLSPWLGPYDPTTLFKRPGISIVLAALSSLHLPFIQTMHLLYLCGLGVLGHSLLRLNYSRVVTAIMFFACGLLPTLYDSNGVRVIREITTGGLELAIFGICLRLYSFDTTISPQQVLRSPSFLVLLALLGLHWSLREEAVLLLPIVFLLVNGALWLRGDFDRLQRRFVLAIVVLILLLIPSGLVYVAVAALNKVSYGIFIVNEVSERNFPRAVSALKRVEESPCDHRLITAEEVQKVLAVSPSFRVVGETLATALAHDPNMNYTDAFGVMRVAALRDNNVSPRFTQRLFARVANEVEAACADGRLRCSGGTRGIVPLLCSSQWPLVPRNFVNYLGKYIARVQHSGFGPWWSGAPGVDRLPPIALENYVTITRQSMTGRSGSQMEFSQVAPLQVLNRQDKLRHWLGSIYVAVMPYLMLMGVVVMLVRLVWIRDKSSSWWVFVLMAMGGHVLVRAVAFAYFSTVDGYLNSRYISVCYPVAVAFAVLATAELRRLFVSEPSVLEGEKASATRTESTNYFPFALALAVLVVGGHIYAGARPGSEPAATPIVAQNASLKTLLSDEFIEVNGRRIRILPKRQGRLYHEAGWLRGESAIFDGWAKDENAPAKAILLFVNGQLLASVTPMIAIPSLEEGFPPEAHVGFSLTVPRRALYKATVRVFALLDDGRAAELQYPASYPYRH